MTTVTLYRPVGPKELELIEASGWRRFPPRRPEQPILYPVLNAEYAAKIARDWNVKENGAGIITRFAVDAEFVRRYPIHTVGPAICQELWVPAEDLDEFNNHIVGSIEIVEMFREKPTLPERIVAAAYREQDGELAWRRRDAPSALAAIAESGQAILGGEVWGVLDDGLYGTIPDRRGSWGVHHWETEPRRTAEAWLAYCRRTADESARVIAGMSVEDETTDAFRDKLWFNLTYVTEEEASP